MASFDTFPQISPQHAQKWTKFLKNHNFNELWLWQYWRNESRPQSQLNKKLFNRFSSKIRAQKEIKELIRNGIPPDHRGAIWWVCSGGGEKMKSAASSTAKPMSYSEYLQLALENSPATQDIMKDLHRTFVSVTGDMNEEGMIPLKNVLLAYSVRNRVVGYCQSMNFITAMLLMHLTEEQAFWVLAALIEDILPSDYYTTSMLGCKMDQAVESMAISHSLLSFHFHWIFPQVFQSCLAWKLPKLFAHFKAHEMILEPITCSWFLCLYINTLPLPGQLCLLSAQLNLVRGVTGVGLCTLGRKCRSIPCWLSYMQTHGGAFFPSKLNMIGTSDPGMSRLPFNVLSSKEALG